MVACVNVSPGLILVWSGTGWRRAPSSTGSALCWRTMASCASTRRRGPHRRRSAPPPPAANRITTTTITSSSLCITRVCSPSRRSWTTPTSSSVRRRCLRRTRCRGWNGPGPDPTRSSSRCSISVQRPGARRSTSRGCVRRAWRWSAANWAPRRPSRRRPCSTRDAPPPDSTTTSILKVGSSKNGKGTGVERFFCCRWAQQQRCPGRLCDGHRSCTSHECQPQTPGLWPFKFKKNPHILNINFDIKLSYCNHTQLLKNPSFFLSTFKSRKIFNLCKIVFSGYLYTTLRAT